MLVPHPVYSGREMALERLDWWFNAGVNDRSGSSPNSPFSRGNEIRVWDLLWYAQADRVGEGGGSFVWENSGVGSGKWVCHLLYIYIPLSLSLYLSLLSYYKSLLTLIMMNIG